MIKLKMLLFYKCIGDLESICFGYTLNIILSYKIRDSEFFQIKMELFFWIPNNNIIFIRSTLRYWDYLIPFGKPNQHQYERQRRPLIRQYYQEIIASNKGLTKKAFKNLLNRLYASDEEIQKIIDKITLCGEATVVNITRKDKSYCGSDDTLYALLLNMKTIWKFSINVRKNN